MEWIDAIHRVLRRIEEQPDGDLSIAALAKEAAYSPFYLQRMFCLLTDVTLADYVRGRRLSMAGQALREPNAKVLDVALRFGYETPESFEKAFRRFHGVTPSAVKKTGAPLRYLNPLRLNVSLTGGTMMDVQMEKLGELRIIGKAYTVDAQTAFVAVPKLWNDYVSKGYNEQVCGWVGLCLDDGQATFTYVIGKFAEDGEEAPQGFETFTLAANEWAKFRAVGALPKAIQDVNRRIYREWLPNNGEYEIAQGCNLEVYYTMGDMQAADYECAIWLPVRRKDK